MQADPSIYGMIRQPQPVEGPMDQYAKGLQIRHMLDSSDLSQMQRQQLMRAMEQEKQTEEAYAQSGGDPTKLRDLLYGRGLYKPAIAAEKANLEATKTRGEIGKTNVETFAASAKQLRDMVAQARGDADMPQIREFAARFLGPEGTKNIPERFDPVWQQKTVMTGDKMIEQLEAQKGRDVTTRGQDMTDARAREQMAQAERHFRATQNAPNLQHVELADGMYTFNPKNGKYEKALGADGQPLQGGKGLTESQGNATGFGLRAARANDLMIDLENKGTFGKVAAAKQSLGTIPLVGGMLEAGANTMLTAPQQQYEQAQRDFINAVLRKESGANINESEFANARKQYFPQPGDDDATIEQKRQNRLTALDSLKVQAGPGAKHIPKAAVVPKPLTKSTIDPAKMSDDELRRELGL